MAYLRSIICVALFIVATQAWYVCCFTGTEQRKRVNVQYPRNITLLGSCSVGMDQDNICTDIHVGQWNDFTAPVDDLFVTGNAVIGRSTGTLTVRGLAQV